MRILLSNDDGCTAPGLLCLRDALQTEHEVTVVAPDRNRSGASNSLTLLNPLRPQRHPDGVWCIDGTPTDCVHLALNALLTEMPHMVVSGINAGANLGDDTLYTDPNRKDEMNGLLGDQARLKKEHDALEGELLDAMEALETAESELGT